MISKINIKNFQSHKKTTLEFNPGVNVIVGASDSGKTAIIRALRWLVWNRPSGDSFRSNWGGNTEVVLNTDSHQIARVKSDTENKYTLTDSEDITEFKAMSSSVPDEVANAISLDEVNLQQQLDTPFLLSETPGKVAGYFNKIAGIDVIDLSLQKVQREIRSTNELINFQTEDLKSMRNEIKKYDNLEKAEVELEVLEDIERSRNTLSKRIKSLGTILIQLQTVEDKIKGYSQILVVEKQVTNILSKIKERQTLYENKVRINNILVSIESLQNKITYYSNFIHLENFVTDLLQNIRQNTQYKADLATFRALVNKIYTLQTNVKETALQLKKLTELFKENLTVCPLCGTKIK